MEINTFPLTDKKLFNSIITNELKKLVQIFKDNNFEIRIAGGAVRDILMGIMPHDIDFASDATPEQMKEMFVQNNIRMIHTKGESHGTITARIDNKENFEITTLRIDRVPDGRWAQVEFTKDWRLDAERRDLTINALFLDLSGIVYDYFGGISDIKSRTVRFVGDSSKRIEEDYLRILRYFRFYGRISEFPDNHDPNTLRVISEHRDGLGGISGERIWLELKKIICGNFAPKIIETMRQCRLLPFLGLPEKPNSSLFENRFNVCRQNTSHCGVFLSALFHDLSELQTAQKRLKLSNDEYIIASFFVTERNSLNFIIADLQSDEAVLKYITDECAMCCGDSTLPRLRLHFTEYLKYIDRCSVLNKFLEWKEPKFPVKGNQVKDKWNVKDREIGAAMNFLKQKWKEIGYLSSENDLLDESYKNEFFKVQQQSR